MRLAHSFSPFEEICILFDENNLPVTVSVWRESDLPAGTICLARAVKAVASGWFLDTGNGGTVYLNTSPFFIKADGTVSTSKLTEGDLLLVEIVRPAVRDKTAEARARISLPGKTVIFRPGTDQISFSKHLSDKAADRLRSVLPRSGVLFRTAAEFETEQNIRDEFSVLEQRWQSILRSAAEPGILYRPEKDVFALADQYKKELTRIITDDSRTAALLKEKFPDVSFCLQGIWEQENMAEALDAALSERTALPSGGFLITQQTAACVCFDVNAGSGKIGAANIEACGEILRQIRLKSLGGQMIIDFAGKKEKSFLRDMAARLKQDGIFVAGFSSLGLVELTVEKTRRSVFDAFEDERTAADLIRRLWFAAPVSAVKVYAPLADLNRLRPYLRRLEDRLKTDIELCPSDHAGLEGLKE
ncbi:MAG: ribonuclease E/G [Alphaproteobacteria bacterium]